MIRKIHKIPFLNYLGQLRIYSLIDLILMLVAARAGKYEFVGALLLHIAFLAYLERNHNHSYRNFVPSLVWIIFAVFGIYFFRHIEVAGYILFSYLYTKKNKKGFGVLAPFFRAAQSFFIAAGIIGYVSLTGIVFVLIFLRNFAGDLRDIEKDRKEKLLTLPIFLGMKKSIPGAHLFALLLTSAVWFSFINLEIYWLLIVFLIQIITYELTPR